MGAKALSDCRDATFAKLFELLVDSVLSYGVEVGGCSGQLVTIEKIQLRAALIFLGVGKLTALH